MEIFAAGAVARTPSAARKAADFEEKDSPELATIFSLAANSRHRHLPPMSS